VRRFIVVEGLIGVGKTTLCKLLEKEWGAELVLEPAEDNPFLGPFYSDPQRYALPVQMFYLLTRWKQQDQIAQLGLFDDLVVSDYLFVKDRLFAEKTLNDEELDIYDRIATNLGAHIPKPDLVIALHAPVATLLKRIAKRQAPGEEHIKSGYLVDLHARYQKLWSSWTASPVLHIDNTDLNYLDDPDGQMAILDRIRAALDGQSDDAPGSASDREEQPSLF